MTRKTFNKEKGFYCIQACYELGGMNYFSGNINPRGIYIHFDIKEIADGWIKSSLFDGKSFKILFQELKRKSAKKVSEAEVWIKANEDELFNMYESMNKNSLLEFVQSVHINQNSAVEA